MKGADTLGHCPRGCPSHGELEGASALCASSESTQQGYFPESAHCGHCDRRRRKYVADGGGKRAEGMELGGGPMETVLSVR